MKKEELGNLYEDLAKKGNTALEVLNLALSGSSFLAADSFTLADIALPLHRREQLVTG